MIKIIGITVYCALLAWFLFFLKEPAIAIILGFGAVAWFFVNLKKRQDELEAKFQKQFAGKNIKHVDKCAIFRAQESKGYSQAQGKGYLVLTDKELYFEMVLLNIALSIPVTKITNVEQTNRLLGTNPGRAMLKVEYKDDNGKRDAIALNVKKLDEWVEVVGEVIKKRQD